MERYGSITTPVSVPRLIVGAMLAARCGRAHPGVHPIRVACRTGRLGDPGGTVHPVGHTAQPRHFDARVVRGQLFHHGAHALRPRPAVWDDPRRTDLLQHPDYNAASPDAPHRMEARQFGADRRGGDLDGLLHPRNSEPGVGLGRGMVLVGAVDRLLFLLHRRAHTAHDDRVQIPEIHARRLVGADTDRRRESLHAEILRL